MRVANLLRSVLLTFLCTLATAALASGGPPVILAVIPDIDPEGIDRLFIVGKRLPGGQHLTVRLGEAELPVRRAQPDLIVVRLPAEVPDGSYRLRASNYLRTATFSAAISRDAGSAGPEGPTGPEGPAGDVGPEGAPGPAGAAGPNGEPGPAGAQGDSGATGPAGPQGVAGPAGPPGGSGPQGLMGLPGPDGPAGAVGPEGPLGPQGIQGIAGEAAVDLTDELCDLATWVDSAGGPSLPTVCVTGASGRSCGQPGITQCFGNAVQECESFGTNGNEWVVGPDCGGSGQACRETFPPAEAACVNLSGCDPTNPAAACGFGQRCEFPTDGSQPAFCGIVAGPGGANTICEESSECQAGLSCAIRPASVPGGPVFRSCQTTCVVGVEGQCPGLLTCAAFPNAVAENTAYGVCTAFPP